MSSQKKAQIKLIVIATAIATVFLFYKYGYLQFSSRLQKFEERATNLVVKEVKKQISAPPPLRLPAQAGATAAKPASQIPTAQAPLTISGTIKWTNIQRRDNGNLPPLAENSQLDTIAMLRLEDMFAKQYFAHIAPDGSGAESVAKSVGYDYIALGENLALGNFLNDEDLVQAWMNSPGHRANILNTKYQETGVSVKKGIFEGRLTWLGVQIFGKPVSSCPQVDQTLRTRIEASQSELTAMQQTLAALRSEIDSTEPKGGREYNQKVDEYNALVAQYNNLVAQTKAVISEYNGEVNAFNQCLAT